jgi:hypothetical protein
MLELNVSNVPHATASDDGLTLTIIFDLEDGGQARMHIPYGQYDWWIQAMQVVASAAFRKQVEAGRVTAIPNPVNATQIADSVRILANPKYQHALMQVTGRAFENGPLAMGSVLFSPSLVESLARSLRKSTGNSRARTTFRKSLIQSSRRTSALLCIPDSGRTLRPLPKSATSGD